MKSVDNKYVYIVQRKRNDNEKYIDVRINRILKCVFFTIVCLLLMLISILGILVIYNISTRENIGVSDVGIAFTGLSGEISSIMVLPQIIAKHLFPNSSITLNNED